MSKLEQSARQVLEWYDGNVDGASLAFTALREALDNSLKPKCFADYQPNHAINRACASCPVAAECQIGEQAEQEHSAAPSNMVYSKPSVFDGVCCGCSRKSADGWALYCVECWEKSNGDLFANGGKMIAEQAEQEPEPEDIKLPVDVTIGCGTIKAGCSLQTLLTRIKVINETWISKMQAEQVHEALQIASVALQDIACSSQTENLYWWQLRARKAQKQIAERLTNAAPVRTKDPTDDEILAVARGIGIVFDESDKEQQIDDIQVFARAVIAADREKNK